VLSEVGAILDLPQGDADGVSISEVMSALLGPSLAVMLYGSRARGNSRSDSDVDVLQVVSNNPRSYSDGRVNIAAYTPSHLAWLAERGSLFIRHLCDEGVILRDKTGILAGLLKKYRKPANYLSLKRELAVIFAAISDAEVDTVWPGVTRLAIYATRTALYVRADEIGELSFDVEKACVACGILDLSDTFRSARSKVVQEVVAAGKGLIAVSPPSSMPKDLPSAAIWAQDNYPMAAMLLTAIVAGETEIEYTSLTLPRG
jgi:predicted nucleotidyltransferase